MLIRRKPSFHPPPLKKSLWAGGLSIQSIQMNFLFCIVDYTIRVLTIFWSFSLDKFNHHDSKQLNRRLQMLLV